MFVKDFCGGAVDKTVPASTEDAGSIPGPGRLHVLSSNRARVPAPPSRALQPERRSLEPCPQQEKAREQQWRPSEAKNRETNKTFWQFLKMLNIYLLFSLMALELLLFWCVYVCVWIFEMALISLQFASLFLLASETKVRYVPLLLSWYIFQFQRRSFFPPCSISLQVVFPLGAVLSTVYLVWKTKKATRGLTAYSRNLGNSGVTKPVQVPDRP